MKALMFAVLLLITSTASADVGPVEADFTDDGVPDIVEQGEDGNSLVFTDGATGQTVTMPGLEGDEFGAQIGAGDFNGDGTPDLVASAPGKDARRWPFTNNGQVFIVSGGWDFINKVFNYYLDWNVFGSRKAELGTTITVLGDVDGDGKDEFEVGDVDGSVSTYGL